MADRTRLDVAEQEGNAREAEVLRLALAEECPECRERPEFWCFRADGVWTVHASRILAAGWRSRMTE